MEGILAILVIIFATVISNNKKKKVRMASRPPVRPAAEEVPQEPEMIHHPRQIAMPIEEMLEEPEDNPDDILEMPGAMEGEGFAQGRQAPQVKTQVKVQAQPQVHTQVETRVQTKVHAPFAEGEGIESAGHPIRREIKIQTEGKAAQSGEDADGVEIPGLNMKLNQEEMVRAVVFSEILNRRPPRGGRRYS